MASRPNEMCCASNMGQDCRRQGRIPPLHDEGDHGATGGGRRGARRASWVNRAVLEQAFGAEAGAIFDQVQSVQIIACGTSYHAGLIAKYWIEGSWLASPVRSRLLANTATRPTVVLPGSLFLTISQSGETADTLAALREAKQAGFLACLTICNVPGSSLVRESDLALMTNAGPEIGVALDQGLHQSAGCSAFDHAGAWVAGMA